MSDKGVAALRPRAARYAISDPELNGLWVRVQPSGGKSYATVARSPDGKQIWTTIGSTDAMLIEKAREAAREILQRVRAGLPAVEPKAETFGAVVATWRKRHVEANGLRSAREINRLLDTHMLPAWRDRPIASIRRGDVTTLLDHVEDHHGARAADYILNITRSIMNWRASRSDDYNPPVFSRGMKRQKVAARSRVLNDDEIRAVWQAAESQPGAFAAIVRLCLLTAQRSRKVAAMKWEDIEAGVWSVPKEAREKDTGGALALPSAALAIIDAQPRFASSPSSSPPAAALARFAASAPPRRSSTPSCPTARRAGPSTICAAPAAH